MIRFTNLLSRRDWLAQSAAALGGLGLAPHAFAQQPAATQTAKPAADMNGYIDAHVHVWTPDVKKFPLAEGFKPADMKPPSFTPEELFAHARPCGVTRVVLIQMSFYRFD